MSRRVVVGWVSATLVAALGGCGGEGAGVATAGGAGASAAGGTVTGTGGTGVGNGASGAGASQGTAATGPGGAGGLGGLTGLGGAAGQGAAGGGGGNLGGGGAAVSPCAHAPAPAYNPVGEWAAPKLVASVLVTTTADAGAGSLRAALGSAPAGAVIGFSAALAGKSVALGQPLTVARSVTIDGSGAAGVTLDAQRKGNVFNVGQDGALKLVLLSLRLVGGKAVNGGAVGLNGNALDVEIAGCTFEDNEGEEAGALRIGYGRGSKLLVHDSVFRANRGVPAAGSNRPGAGAISGTGARVRIVRTRFESNAGVVSGAWHGIGNNPVIEDSVFVSNVASAGPGALLADGGEGATYADGKPDGSKSGEIAVRRSRFEKNLGNNADGGAAQLYAYPVDTITVEDSVFIDNQASGDPGRAGALFLHGDNGVRVIRTAFVGNTAATTGGAIWGDGGDPKFVVGEPAYEFENVLFSGNAATVDLGGAMRLNISESMAVRIQHATFANNTAPKGNGVLWLPGVRKVTVSNSLLVNNTAFPWAQQINFAVTDGGGNFEWPNVAASYPSLGKPQFADPLLEPLSDVDTVPVRMLGGQSKALGAAKSPSPSVDLRRAPRDAAPDSGAVERDAVCK